MHAIKIAKVVHESNRALCEVLRDHSQPSFRDIPDWQLASCLDGIRHRQENPESKPHDSHINWMATKIAEGWVWGPLKDVNAKRHPCLVPYHDLPVAQQAKDKLFIAIVDALTDA